MKLSFFIDIANNIGLNKAIILEKFDYWVKTNKYTNQNYIDGKYWTFNSVRELRDKYFTFLTDSQIRKSIKELIDDGFLIKGCYNKRKNDRRNWYSLTDEGLEIISNSELKKHKRHSFDTKIAERIGLGETLLLDNFYCMLVKNKDSEDMWINDMVWYYTTIKSISNYFPYLKSPYNVIKRLLDGELIIINKFNKENHNNTNMNWYSITEQGFAILGKQMPQFSIEKNTNGFSKNTNGFSKNTNVYSNTIQYSTNNNILKEEKFFQKQDGILYDKNMNKDYILKLFSEVLQNNISNAKDSDIQSFLQIFKPVITNDGVFTWKYVNPHGREITINEKQMKKMISHVKKHSKHNIFSFTYFVFNNFASLKKAADICIPLEDIPQSFNGIEITKRDNEEYLKFKERAKDDDVICNLNDGEEFVVKIVNDKYYIICNTLALCIRFMSHAFTKRYVSIVGNSDVIITEVCKFKQEVIDYKTPVKIEADTTTHNLAKAFHDKLLLDKGKRVYDVWLIGLKLIKVNGNTAIITAPTKHNKNCVIINYEKAIKYALEVISNGKITEVSILSEEELGVVDNFSAEQPQTKTIAYKD